MEDQAPWVPLDAPEGEQVENECKWEIQSHCIIHLREYASLNKYT